MTDNNRAQKDFTGIGARTFTQEKITIYKIHVVSSHSKRSLLKGNWKLVLER